MQASEVALQQQTDDGSAQAGSLEDVMNGRRTDGTAHGIFIWRWTGSLVDKQWRRCGATDRAAGFGQSSSSSQSHTGEIEMARGRAGRRCDLHQL
jgi:hypothetical protein